MALFVEGYHKPSKIKLESGTKRKQSDLWESYEKGIICDVS